jgi:hypothetical protein
MLKETLATISIFLVLGFQTIFLPPVTKTIGVYCSFSEIIDIINKTIPEYQRGYKDIEVADWNYRLYPKDIVEKALTQIPDWVGVKEGNDCDDKAEWYKLALKRVLPQCAVIYIGGLVNVSSTHVFIGVVFSDKTIGWYLTSGVDNSLSIYKSIYTLRF